MKKKYGLLFYLLTSSYLLSCTSVNKSAALNDSFRVKQTIKATTNADLIKADRPDQYYEIGRRYQKNGNHSLATIAYQKSLALDPSYAKSLTGLASVHADMKLYSSSTVLFEKVVKIEPNAVNYNNLGYAHYLNKQYSDAYQALSQSVKLDPNYRYAKNNLDMVAAIQTQETTPASVVNDYSPQLAPEYNQAVALTTKVSEQLQMAGIDLSNTDRSLNNQTKMTQTASGIYELSINLAKENDVTIAQEQQKNNIKTQPITLAAASGGVNLKHSQALYNLFDYTMQSLIVFKNSQDINILEIVNGNGVKGIARVVANKMQEAVSVSLKVSDAKSFNYSRTFIQYKPGYRNDAVILNRSLLNKPYLLLSNNLPKGITLRLVLGKDLFLQTYKAYSQLDLATEKQQFMTDI